MEYSTVVQLINGVGFPIACCVALFHQNTKQSENHKTEMTELKTVIENNTLILRELITKIDDMKEGN